jgi:hypothetical protein
METTSNPATIPLFWSRLGAVACATHAPGADRPEWSADGWKPVAALYRVRRGVELRCQWCHGTPIAPRAGRRLSDLEPVSEIQDQDAIAEEPRASLQMLPS